MKTTTTKHDSRINRDNDAFTFLQLCREFTNREFNGGWQMSWNEFKTSSYRNSRKGIYTQVDVLLDFNTNTITITEE